MTPHRSRHLLIGAAALAALSMVALAPKAQTLPPLAAAKGVREEGARVTARGAGSPRAPATLTAYCARRLGAWFYCEGEETGEHPPAPAQGAEPDDLAEMDAYQKAVDHALKLASWNPTPANVERFIRLQRVALDKSSLMSDLWRRLIWTTPELDYTLERPTNALGKGEADNERSEARDLFLREVSPEVGVFYVYAGNCAACRVASPIIKAFSDRFGVAVRVISTDGAQNPVFGETFADHGQLAGWGIDHAVTPALLIYQGPSKIDRDGAPILHQVDTPDGRRLSLRPCLQGRGCLTYLGAGVMSVEDIAERLFVLLSKDPGTDY